MAQLTDYLPTVTDGKNITQPYKPAPSIFENLTDAAQTGIDMVQGAAQTRAKREAAKRQARSDYLDESDRAAKNAAAEKVANEGILGLNSPGVAPATPSASPSNAQPFTPAEIEQTGAVMDAGDALGQKAATLQAGVKQGRVSPAQYELIIEQDMRSLMAKYPDSKFVIMEQMSKYVKDSPGMSEYRAAQAELERESTAKSVREEKAIDYAITQKGASPDTPRDQLISYGYQQQANDAAAKAAQELAEHEAARADRNQKQLDRINGARDDAMVKYVHGAITPVIQSAMDQFTTIMTDKTIPDAQKMQAASDFVNTYKPKAYELIEQNLTIAMNKYGMTPEAADKERTRLRSQVDDIATQFSSDNPVNQFAIKGKILQTMKDGMGLDALQAMPILKQFENALGTPESVQALVDHAASDPELQKVFTQELKDFNGLTLGDQTIRLKNLISFVSDRNTSLKDYSPQESAQIIKDSAGLLDKGVYAQAITGEPAAQRTVLNTLGKVANAAVDLNQGSSTRSLVNAVNFLANDSAFKTLARLNPEHKEFGNLVGDEVRAATGKALMSLIAQGQRDPYFKWQINDKTHRFELAPNGRAPARSSVSGIVGGLGPSGPGATIVDQPKPSIELRAQVAAMNKAASFLMASTPMEDNPALKNATFNEKWRFYTRGESPESSQTDAKPSASGRERLSRLQNFWANVKIDWSKVPQVNVEGEVSRTTGLTGGGNTDPYNTILGNGQYGTPPKRLTQLTVGEAVDFGKNTLIPNSKAAGVGVNTQGQTVGSSAMGAFQITISTLMDFAPKVLGEDWRNKLFTPEVQSKIGKAIFEAKKNGNLKAVWTSLTDSTPGAYADKTWEEMKQIIAAGEVSADAGSL